MVAPISSHAGASAGSQGPGAGSPPPRAGPAPGRGAREAHRDPALLRGPRLTANAATRDRKLNRIINNDRKLLARLPAAMMDIGARVLPAALKPLLSERIMAGGRELDRGQCDVSLRSCPSPRSVHESRQEQPAGLSGAETPSPGHDVSRGHLDPSESAQPAVRTTSVLHRGRASRTHAGCLGG